MTGYEACPICGNYHEGSACPRQSFADGERIVKQAMEKLSDASKGDFMKAYYRIDLSDNHLRKIVSESNSDASFAGAFVIPLIDALLTTRCELAEMKEAMRFIPVSERLPEKETTEQWEMYLCKLNRYGEEHVAPLSFICGSWYSDSHSDYSEYVVAWMPIPLPPAPEGKNGS